MGNWTHEIGREERVHAPIHPGEMLREEWRGPRGMNANQLAKALGVPRQSIYEIVGEKRGLSAEMALRLARWSGMSPHFWLGLQEFYELQMVEWQEGERIEREVTPLVTDATRAD